MCKSVDLFLFVGLLVVPFVACSDFQVKFIINGAPTEADGLLLTEAQVISLFRYPLSHEFTVIDLYDRLQRSHRLTTQQQHLKKTFSLSSCTIPTRRPRAVLHVVTGCTGFTPTLEVRKTEQPCSQRSA